MWAGWFEDRASKTASHVHAIAHPGCLAEHEQSDRTKGILNHTSSSAHYARMLPGQLTTEQGPHAGRIVRHKAPYHSHIQLRKGCADLAPHGRKRARHAHHLKGGLRIGRCRKACAAIAGHHSGRACTSSSQICKLTDDANQAMRQ